MAAFRDSSASFGRSLSLAMAAARAITNQLQTNLYLEEANLRAANLRGANLSGANLRQAQMTKATLPNGRRKRLLTNIKRLAR